MIEMQGSIVDPCDAYLGPKMYDSHRCKVLSSSKIQELSFLGQHIPIFGASA